MKGKLYENNTLIGEKILDKNPIEKEYIKYLDKNYIIRKVILCDEYIRLDVYIVKPQKIIW